MSKPISIQLYTVRKIAEKDYVGTVRQIADIGYAAVEPAGLGGLSPKEFRKFIDDLGMVVSSNHVRMPTKENLNETVDVAKTLGYDLVISGFGPDDFKTVDNIKRTAGKFQEAAQLLKPHGLKIGVHNHWWEFDTINGRTGYDILMEAAPDLHGELDIYWAANFGAVDPAKQVARFKHRLPLLHVKDGPLLKDQPHTAVGKGKMNIPACIHAADPNVLKYLIVELDECATDMMTAVRESYEYLTRTGLARGRK